MCFRCIKWLPFACLALFLLCGALPWVLWPKRPVTTPAEHPISITFRAFSVDGVEIGAKARDRDGNQLKLPDHWQKKPGVSATIVVTPMDPSRYREKTEVVTWLKPAEFRTRLNGIFLEDMKLRKGAHPDKWKDTLKQLNGHIGDDAYDYPIILDNE